ncbi:YidC family membrane integrase SpoIIIJ [Sutcliffiella horikoshii]|uniref:Membrane protein insertase YidC n=2 Tax=Sutcliffiella horikoshii TaxID=79883 RepID=A0A1Y0CTA0_9BACI|nr:YidC family membrane integrase SpoIIIJ [Sutcliffiella horikoshii]ART78482.1 OxaA precursor [Sutcliffiella horikoshii]TYS59585.1 YidC family membrane integrase SpoIIIJ [Sutcliffiella horikoshii]TYS70277.1 YidC family membrane integrase SpoIIIJ [Sutcliffiella horikoshii]
MKNRIWLLMALIGLVALLSGCTEINQPITNESEGFWNEYVVYPLSWLITYFAELMNNDYGLSIIIVTLLIRFAILPLMIKQTKNAKAMQALQPEMKALREKYSSKDQKTQQKLQQETMGLFQKHGVNPLAGCFPLLVQMPILIGFFHAITRTTEIANHNFLWFDLGDPDPFFILPVVAGITTFIQQKIMMAGMDNNPQMVMMLWIMPIMIVVFAINFPAALSLYWVVGNIFMIVQTYFIKGPELRKAKEAAAGTAGGTKK